MIQEIKEYVRHLKALCPETLEIQYFESLISRVEDLEPDALKYRKIGEMKGRNPEVPCACVIDEQENWVRRCGFHGDIVNKLEEGIGIAIHLLRNTGMNNEERSQFESLKKLVGKED